MTMRIHELLLEMTYSDAVKVFTTLGVADPNRLDSDSLKKAHRKLVLTHHPDRGGDLKTMQNINAAYDVLKSNPGHPGDLRPRYDPYRWSTPEDEDESPEDTTWAWAGHSGGYPPNTHISRKDYTDANYIKKRLWELSGHSNEEWTITAFDGAFFRHSVTAFASPKIFREMARAMSSFNSGGGNRYLTRAVFASRRNEKKLFLIYADGRWYDAQNTPTIEYESFNLNPSNDQNLTRRLPEWLDNIKSQRRR